MNTDQQQNRWPSVRTLLIAGIAVAALVALAVNSTPGEQAPSDVAIDTTGTPALEVDSDYLDFGDVPFSEMVEASFEVTNVGDATLLFAEKPFIEVKDGC